MKGRAGRLWPSRTQQWVRKRGGLAEKCSRTRQGDRKREEEDLGRGGIGLHNRESAFAIAMKDVGADYKSHFGT